MKKKKQKIKVICPNCKTSFSYYESEYRPFCSKKCQMIDLGQWLNESYAIPTQEGPESEDEQSDE